MEQFYTIQGEGFHQGRAAYFIRLGGCDVGCVWCDVKESWDAGKHTLKSIDEIIIDIKRHPVELIVITGGEPLMYDLTELTEALHAHQYKINLETSGAYPLSGSWDWICFSPKKFKKPLAEVGAQANELKVVIYNKSDFAWAEENRRLVSPECKLYLQPEWSRNAEMTALIIDYVKKYPDWEISLQLHKYLNVP
ncbi:MAG: 7-carboxy-7-deazaguanine synthase QueE [Chitinophagales bacterium]